MFESNFPREWAEEILKRIQRQFGTQFDKLYPQRANQNADDYQDDMILMACEVLDGLNAEDIKTGLAKMRSEEWCPTIPKFRALCEKTSSWLTPDEAWAQVQCAADDRNTVVWTEQAQQAWAACQPLIEIGDKFSAARCFKDAYKRAVDEASLRGMKPIYQVSLGYDQNQRITVVREAESKGMISQKEAVFQIGYIEQEKAAKPEFVQSKLAEIWAMLEQGNA